MEVLEKAQDELTDYFADVLSSMGINEQTHGREKVSETIDTLKRANEIKLLYIEELQQRAPNADPKLIDKVAGKLMRADLQKRLQSLSAVETESQQSRKGNSLSKRFAAGALVASVMAGVVVPPASGAERSAEDDGHNQTLSTTAATHPDDILFTTTIPSAASTPTQELQAPPVLTQEQGVITGNLADVEPGVLGGLQGVVNQGELDLSKTINTNTASTTQAESAASKTKETATDVAKAQPGADARSSTKADQDAKDTAAAKEKRDASPSSSLAAGKVSALLQRGESGKDGYNAFNRGTATINGKTEFLGSGAEDLSELSVGEYLKRSKLPASDNQRLFAVGKYQVIPGTMKSAIKTLGISRDEKLTPELQDKIFVEYLLKEKRPAIYKYIHGKSDDINAAVLAASQEWASVASPKTGKSYYDGDGVNSANISVKEMKAALKADRSATLEGEKTEAKQVDTAVDQAAESPSPTVDSGTNGTQEQPTEEAQTAEVDQQPTEQEAKTALLQATSKLKKLVASREIYKSSAKVEIPDSIKDRVEDLGVRKAADGTRVHIVGIKDIKAPGADASTRGSKFYVGSDGLLITNVRMAETLVALADYARTQGVTLTANSGFRTHAQQKSLSAKQDNAAQPGSSPHEKGLAVDFSITDGSASKAAALLKKLGKKLGLYQFDNGNTAKEFQHFGLTVNNG